jgi:hypothetical protein
MAGERTPRSAGLLEFQHRVREEAVRVEIGGREVSLVFARMLSLLLILHCPLGCQGC